MRPRALLPPRGIEAERERSPLFLPPLGRWIRCRRPALLCGTAATRYSRLGTDDRMDLLLNVGGAQARFGKDAAEVANDPLTADSIDRNAAHERAKWQQ